MDGLTHKLSSSQKSNQRNSTLLSSCPVAALRLCITPVIFLTFPFQWGESFCRVNIILGVKSGMQKMSLMYQRLDGISGPHGLPGCPGASTR